MKAIIVEEPGGPEKLLLSDVPDPVPGPGDLLLDVRATALNRADLLQRRGKYPPPPGASDILGLECAGIVSECGADVTAVRPGERVMALLPGGGYATRVVIPEGMAIPIPENLSFEEAAALPEAFLTAREALFSLGRLRSGDVVLVHAAAGGVGSAAVQLAVQAGAHVVATAGSAEKLARVAELGAQTLVNYRVEDFARAVANTGRGASVVLDFVGGSYWEQHATCLADGGRCVVIGVLGGAKATVNLGQLLFKRLQILGLVMRSRSIEDKVAMTRSFVAETLPLFATGRLRPVIDSVYEMADVAKAHTRMEENANVGKVILRVG